MKIKQLMIILSAVCLIACASPEERSTEQTDTNTVNPADTPSTDTTTNVNGRSGDNGTGTDTTNTTEEKALRESENQN